MAHSYHRAFYHFAWATWDREPLLVDKIEQVAYKIIQAECEKARTECHAIGGIADHVHLLVSIPPTVLIADFMDNIKGVSSRALNEEFSAPTWSFKWQAGYGYHTVCPGHIRVIRRYIENQKQHHADGMLWPEGEPPERD
jgi:putative transposase